MNHTLPYPTKLKTQSTVTLPRSCRDAAAAHRDSDICGLSESSRVPATFAIAPIVLVVVVAASFVEGICCSLPHRPSRNLMETKERLLLSKGHSTALFYWVAQLIASVMACLVLRGIVVGMKLHIFCGMRPSSFAAYGLVDLNMPNSSINCLWEDRKHFPCLKKMDLSNSKYLRETPDFSGVPSLERQDLSGCTDLSFQLAFLSLRNCSNLISIEFHNGFSPSSLRVLHFSGCTKLENTPDFTWTTNLEYLDFGGCTSLSSVHESIGVLAKLTFLSLRDCTSLVSIPSNNNIMKSLQTLDFSGCFQFTDYSLGNNHQVQKGWLLWAGVGLVGSIIATSLTRVVVSSFSGETPQREHGRRQFRVTDFQIALVLKH
ncbi:hypothetical protein V8G54_009290 [Vigna mungo]|uniref:Uncharacterized protein n=1 Tax=Vigna mungo TaxID=3915 RepID=A0AAQ3S4Q3_VIGMU